MEIRWIADDEGDEICATLTVGGNPWDLFCDHYEITQDRDTRRQFISMAGKAGFVEHSIDVTVGAIGTVLSSTKTSDFITIKKAITDLLRLAENKAVTDADKTVVERARRAIAMFIEMDN